MLVCVCEHASLMLNFEFFGSVFVIHFHLLIIVVVFFIFHPLTNLEYHVSCYYMLTAPKLNMDPPPKCGGLEDEFPFQRGDFQVPC